MNSNGSGSVLSRIISAVIMGIIFLVVLMLVVFSAKAYEGSVDIQNENYSERAAVGFVITAVKANKTDSIYIDSSSGTDMLVISDGVSGLEQHIYFRDGQLIENYGEAGRDFVPDGEEVIGTMKQFEMTMVTDDLLKITTEYGDSYVNIGS